MGKVKDEVTGPGTLKSKDGTEGKPANHELKKDLNIPRDKVMYDEHAKRVLANKEILSEILKGTVKEVSGYTSEEIASMIEGTPRIGEVNVDPGLSNLPSEYFEFEKTINSRIDEQKSKGISNKVSHHKEENGIIANKISGDNTEDIIPGEGEVKYDILTHLIIPGEDGPIKILINVEAQRNYHPGYDLVTRSILWCKENICTEGNRI